MKKHKSSFSMYLEYVKDNPNGYWFKRKLYGWGWTPVRWQGWLVTLLFLAYIGILSYTLESSQNPKNDFLLFFIGIILAIVILIGICYKTGEKPKWVWGFSSLYDKKKGKRSKRNIK